MFAIKAPMKERVILAFETKRQDSERYLNHPRDGQLGFQFTGPPNGAEWISHIANPDGPILIQLEGK